MAAEVVDDMPQGAAVVQVAVLTEQLRAPLPGGTGRYTADLLLSLAAARPEGGSVIEWCARHRDAIAQPPQHQQLPLSRRALSLAWSFGLGPVPSGADVVHAPTPLAPAHLDRRLIVTIHDDVPWTHPQTLTRYGAQWHRRIERRIARTAHAVVVPTAAVASRLGRVLPTLTGDRLVVAANPLPRQRAERLAAPLGDEQDRAARLRLPDRYLLFVGTREPRKGLDVLLSALRQPAGPRLPLLIVGQAGWGAADPGEDRHVRLMGRLDEDDLGVIYRGATVLVLPSRAEGFGYPVVEAMTAGTPVVTSDDPALIETSGGAALSSPVGEAAALADVLRRVEDDAGLRRELIERGRVRARDFQELAYGRTMWELYAQP